MFDKFCFRFFLLIDWIVDKLLIIFTVLFSAFVACLPALAFRQIFDFSWSTIFEFYGIFGGLALLFWIGSYLYDRGWAVMREMRERGDFKK